jgi:hypothetical protein
MSVIAMELMLYHPATEREEEETLYLETITDDLIEEGLTFELPNSGGVTGDKRVLLGALRRVEGSTANLSSVFFTFTFKRKREAPEQPLGIAPAFKGVRVGEPVLEFLDKIEIPETVLPVDKELDLSVLIGSDFDWHGFYLTHQEPMALDRVHVTWGGATVPPPTKV